MSKVANCPECDEVLELDDEVRKDEDIVCDNCGVDLTVVSVNPVELDLADDEEEDWGE